MASEVGKLSEDAKKAAVACGEVLCTLRFQPYGTYELCDDNTGLLQASTDFFKFFAPSVKVLAPQMIARCATDINSEAVFNERDPNQRLTFYPTRDSACETRINYRPYTRTYHLWDTFSQKYTPAVGRLYTFDGGYASTVSILLSPTFGSMTP